MLTAGKGLRGVSKGAKAVKAKASADGKMELFTGLKVGIDLAGSLQWLDPEGFIDPKSPKKKDSTKTWGGYADVALVSAGVTRLRGRLQERQFRHRGEGVGLPWPGRVGQRRLLV